MWAEWRRATSGSAYAQEEERTVCALDLDDLAHSHAYTAKMKVRHLVRSANRRTKALKADFSGVADPYELAVQWDEALLVKPLRELEAETAQAYQRSLLGRCLDVLCEGADPKRPGHAQGTSCRYVPVSFRGHAPALQTADESAIGQYDIDG